MPKLSPANGLVYTYTKDPQPDNQDAWYLTALDFRTGKTLFKRLGGEGLGHNNNYAPITLGPDGTAYVGVLGGLIGLRDATPPPGAAGGPPASSGGARSTASLRLKVRRLKGGRLRRARRRQGRAAGPPRHVPGARQAGARGPQAAVPRDVARKRLKRPGRTRIVARIVRKDGTRAKRVKRVRRR